MRAFGPALWLAAAIALAGCFSAPSRIAPPASTGTLPSGGAPDASDVIPRVEPKSRYGNPPYYDVFGKRYYVLSSSADYVERGVASWYGPGFHNVRTSTGEPYDMYGMSAAHRTLPLPAYVRVTNLQNGRSVVVRVNDRGPFVDNRIIDLSYTAAQRLDMLRNGTAMVEVRSLDPTLPAGPPAPLTAAAAPAAMPAATLAAAPPMAPPAAPPAAAPAAHAALQPAPAPRTPLFVQAGAFADPANAERLAARLRTQAFDGVLVRDDVIAGRRMYRVRIGPVPDVPQYDRIVAALERAGVHDAHLALN